VVGNGVLDAENSAITRNIKAQSKHNIGEIPEKDETWLGGQKGGRGRQEC